MLSTTVTPANPRRPNRVGRSVGAIVWLARQVLSACAHRESLRAMTQAESALDCVERALHELDNLRPGHPGWRALKLRTLRNLRLGVPMRLRGPGFFLLQEIRRQMRPGWRGNSKCAGPKLVARQHAAKHLARVAEIDPDVKKVATEVFGDFDAALHWLSTPLPIFGYRRPEDLCGTPEGIAAVMRVLNAIQTGGAA